MLGKEKAIDWELGYAMTIHTIGRVEYLSQLIRIEGPSLPSEIEDAKNKKAIERSLRPFISEKLIGYMDQDKKKGPENPDQWTVDRIDNKLGTLKEIYVLFVLNAIRIIESDSLNKTRVLAI
ncbi:8440_t:CDS:2, partial [Racocetra persica]